MSQELLNLSKSKQAIFLSIGQAGCQIGSSLWALFNEEHGLLPDGTGIPYGNEMFPHIHFYKDSKICKDDEFHRNFSYMESNEIEKYLPRTLFIDLEPTIIDEIKSGVFRNLFSDDLNYFQFSRMGDGASIFPRAYNVIGRYIIANIMNSIRRLVEKTDKLSLFNISRSFGGATGSGIGSLVLENLHDNYPKINLAEICILNSALRDSPTTDPYNSLFGIESSCSCSDVTFLYNNNALEELCLKKLGIKKQFHIILNQLISYSVSGIYATDRFPGYGNCNMDSIITNLIPFPRVQFPICTAAPLTRKEIVKYEKLCSPSDLTEKIISNDYAMFDIDIQSGTYISCCMIYRGLISPGNIAKNHQELMKNQKMKFIEWNPNGIKNGHSPLGSVDLPNFDLGVSQFSMMMLANHGNINIAFAQQSISVHIMLKKKAFLHWYFENGIEEEDFNGALENLVLLTLDYKEIEKYNENLVEIHDENLENYKSKSLKSVRFKKRKEVFRKPVKQKKNIITSNDPNLLYKHNENIITSNDPDLLYKHNENIIISNDVDLLFSKPKIESVDERTSNTRTLNQALVDEEKPMVEISVIVPSSKSLTKSSAEKELEYRGRCGNVRKSARKLLEKENKLKRAMKINLNETYVNLTLFKTYDESFVENISPKQSLQNINYFYQNLNYFKQQNGKSAKNYNLVKNEKIKNISKRFKQGILCLEKNSVKKEKVIINRLQLLCNIRHFKTYEESFIKSVMPRITSISLTYTTRALEKANFTQPALLEATILDSKM